MIYIRIRKKSMNNQKLKPWVVKQIAKRARFTMSDVKIFLASFEEVLYDIVLEKYRELKNSDEESIEVIKLARLFDLRIKKILAHKGYDAVRRETLDVPESYKLVIKPSRNFVTLMREDKYEVEIEDDDI
jgi:hypothetical protein